MLFTDNHNLISSKNQQLAEKLSQIYIVQAEENIEVYKAENAKYVLSYDGLILDDMLNPEGLAAENFAENLPEYFSQKDILVVFGLGSGYLFKYACTHTDAAIILIEPKIDILRYCIEYVDFTQEFAKENVYIFSDIKHAERLIKELYTKNKPEISVIFPEAYLQLTPEMLGEFQSDITEIVTRE